MFKIMNNFSSTNNFKIIFAFIAGGIITYFIQDYIKLKTSYSIKSSHSSYSSSSGKDQKNRSYDDIHQKMRQRMDRMFDSSFFGNSFFDDSFFDRGAFQSFTQDIQIEESEDARYKVITVIAEGIDKKAMKVNVSDGMVSISGRIRQENEDESSNGYSSTSFSSTFSKSFSVPFGVDANKVEIENDEYGVILKFPKNTI